MPTPTDDDEAFASEVRQLGHPHFSGRDAQYLIEQDALPLPKGGGRGKRTRYTPQCVIVADGIERAKDDPDYKNKFHRAVLIAWFLGAPLGDPLPETSIQGALPPRARESARKHSRGSRAIGLAATSRSRSERAATRQAVNSLLEGEVPSRDAAEAFVRVVAPALSQVLDAFVSDPTLFSKTAQAASAVPQLTPAMADLISSTPELVEKLAACPDPALVKEKTRCLVP